jgi:chemotaxis protein MotB
MKINQRAIPVLALLAMVPLTGCVSQGAYDALQAKNQDLQQQLATQSAQLASAQAQVQRLQGAIKYTVNSDLLFSPGGWTMSNRGKQIIASLASKLAPDQQDKLVVSGYTDNTPISPALQRQGVTSNQVLSEKRAQSVMEFLISQGVKPDLVSAQGFGDSNPVASNATAAGRAQNRRVELSLASPSA